MKIEYVLGLTAVLPRVRHSRMFLAGIQAESGLDPRLKHSGVTCLRMGMPFTPIQFSKELPCHLDPSTRLRVVAVRDLELIELLPRFALGVDQFNPKVGPPYPRHLC
jgi:hypothetical protein